MAIENFVLIVAALNRINNPPEIRRLHVPFPYRNLMMKATGVVGCVACEESVSKYRQSQSDAPVRSQANSIAYNQIRLS